MRLEDFVPLDREFDKVRYAARDATEKRLMFAILEDALRCFQGVPIETRMKRAQIDEAEAWLMSDVRHLFSFRCVCETLGIDPDYLRAGLKVWRDRGGRLSQQQQFAPFADDGKTRSLS